MKSKLAALLLLIAIAVLAMNLLGGKGRLYSELCISQEEMQEIIESREPADYALFSKILFNEYELMFDAAGNRFFYSLIEGNTNLYNPYVEYISQEKDVNIAIVGTDITDEVIADGEEFTILFYTEDLYQHVSLAFTTLPLLSIDYAGEMGEYDTMQMNLRLFDNRPNSTARVVNAEGEIRYRGRYSRNYPKDGYRFTLYNYSVGENRREQNISLLGMRQDADWILYAAYNDQEKIRNVFSSNLWKQSCATNNICGIDNGMEYKYVELFLNGEYWGLYALGYPIDALQLQMTDGEYMYKKTAPEMSEVTIDYNTEGAVAGYEMKELGTNTVESWEPLKNYYRTMLNDSDDYSRLREISDMDNCVDIFLFLNLIQGIDHANLRGENIIHNVYMTNKICNDGQSEVMLYTPWDMDRTWGNGFMDESYNVSADQNVLMQTNIVYLLLEQGNEEVQEKLARRYLELRENAWSDEHITESLSEYEEQIFDSGAYGRDKSRWPDGNYIEEEDRLSLFKDYVMERLKYMDMFMSQYV